MKLVLSAIALIIGLLLGHAHAAQMCTDPNTNTPIDCSLLK